MKVFLLLLLVVAIGIVVGDDCCPYPLYPSKVNSANVTLFDFECSEPIGFQCYLPHGYKEVAVVGLQEGDMGGYVKEDDIITTSSSLLNPVLICDAQTHKFHVKGFKQEYPFYTCGYQLDNGVWIS